MQTCHPRVQRTYGRWKHLIVLPPACRLGPQSGGHHPVTLIQNKSLEIIVTLTEELGVVPSPSHSWMAPLMEDMLCDTRTGLTEAVVIGPGRVFLFYGRCSMGECLMADEARDTAFLLTGAGMWVGKLSYLTADPMTIQEGRWSIAQAITDCQVKAWGPGHPHVNLLTQQPFRFDPLRGFPMKDASGDGGSNHHPSPHWPPKRPTT